MRMTWINSTLVSVIVGVSAAHAAAQSSFQWRGSLAEGQAIEIKGINGDIRAVATSSKEVEVTAIRTAGRSSPDDVHIEVVRHAGGVTICAIYPGPAGRNPNRCEPGSGGRSNDGNSDTLVHFEVRVPHGVAFIGSSVNGEVDGEALSGDAEAHTVNGSVRLATTGRALASTTNGSVNVTMGRADWPEAASFTTVNGEITLTLPIGFGAELRAEMLNGSLTSDFPVRVTGAAAGPPARTLRGVIGDGSRQLTVSTLNGSIRLIEGR